MTGARKRWHGLLLLLLGSLLPQALPAQGFVKWEYQRYLYYPGDNGYHGSSLTAGTSDAWGRATARTYWSLASDTYQRTVLNRFELHLDNVRVAGRQWSIGVGDIRFVESPELTSSAAVRGLSVGGALGPRVSFETSIGRAADLYSRGYAPAFTINDYFLSQRLRINPQRGLTLTHWLTYRHDGRQTVSVYNQPSATSLIVLSSRVESEISPFLSGRNYLSFSRAGYAGHAALIDANCSSQWDLSLDRYLANLAYQYKGSNYVGPSNEGRAVGYNQVSISNSYSLGTRTGLTAGYSQQWSLPAADSAGYSNRSLRWYAGFQYDPAPWPIVTYRLERYAADNSYLNYTYSPRSWRHIVRLNRLFHSYNLQAEYQYQRERGTTGGDQANTINQFGGDASRRWNDWQLSASQQVQRQTYRGQFQWDQGLAAELQWQKNYTSGIGLRWSQLRADGMRWGTDHWGWELSQAAAWPSGWELSTTVRQTLYGRSYLTASFRTLQWNLKLEKHFGRLRDALDLGIAYGRVYEDNNGNGRPDPGEPGVERVPVLLDGSKKTITGDDGVYHISGIAPGKHTITVDSRFLSAMLDPASKGGKGFTSAGVWGPKIDFPITPLNKVFSLVFADLNRNGVQDPDEPGLPGAIVLMGEDRSYTASDDEGYAKFFNVRPGRYQVFMDPKFLPDTLEISGPGSYTVDVEDLKKVPVLMFGIAKKVRPVRRIVFAPSLPESKPAAPPPPPGAGHRQKRASQPQAAKPPQPAELKRLRELGIKQYATGEYQQALRTWQQLLKLDPANTEARRNLQRTKSKLDALKKINR